MPRRMEQMRGPADKKVSKTVKEPRRQSFTEKQYKTGESSSERQHTGNMSEAAQMSKPRSRESVYRDIGDPSQDSNVGWKTEGAAVFCLNPVIARDIGYKTKVTRSSPDPMRKNTL